MVEFLKKNVWNILFFGFVLFLFTPAGLPVRATLIKGVSMITTRIFSLEIDEEDQVHLDNNDWELMSLDGQKVNLSSFAGQVVVVNLWATWCPPCVAEMPGFQDLFDAYGDKVVFLFITNDDRERVQNFIQDKGYRLPVYYQASRAPLELSSNSLPTTYIIGKDGSIVTNKSGAADWNSGKVRRLLDKLLQ